MSGNNNLRKRDSMKLELNFNSDAKEIEELNNSLRGAVEALEESIKLTREARNNINNSISIHLKDYVVSNGVDECYYVKNVSPDAGVCFVHCFDKNSKKFQNIELSKVPSNVKKGDVLVKDKDEYKVDLTITSEILNLKKRIIEASKNSRTLFEVPEKEYVVCDKSDEADEAKMSLKIQESGKEFWGISISKELYNQIKYGSKVKYSNGEYHLIVE